MRSIIDKVLVAMSPFFIWGYGDFNKTNSNEEVSGGSADLFTIGMSYEF